MKSVLRPGGTTGEGRFPGDGTKTVVPLTQLGFPDPRCQLTINVGVGLASLKLKQSDGTTGLALLQYAARVDGETTDGRLHQGDEPDVRFTYANERTFLAWNRTALALIATGVAATQLLPEFHVAGGRRILGLPMVVLGALVAFTSFRQWRANQQAMRCAEPLPQSPMPLVLSVGIGVVAIIAVVLALVGS